MGPLLAHQGGWDEIMMFVVPVVVAIVAVRLVEKRNGRGDDETGTAIVDGSPPIESIDDADR